MSCCPSCEATGGSCGGAQLGDLTVADCRARGMVLDITQTPPVCVPLQLPGMPALPAQPSPGAAPMILASECERREAKAYEAGKSAEASRLVKTTIVTAVISSVVGIALGRVLA